MNSIIKWKNCLIKALGGHTDKEYKQVVKECKRAKEQYQALIDSKTNDKCSQIVNEYIFRTLRTLVLFARNELYGNPSDEWANRLYNTLNNNMYRVLIRYVNMGSTTIYRIDTTLDGPDGFKKVLQHDGNEEALKLIENDNDKISDTY